MKHPYQCVFGWLLALSTMVVFIHSAKAQQTTETVKLRLLFDGVEAEEATKTRAGLRNVLSRFGVTDPGGNDEAWVNKIRRESGAWEATSQKFKSLGGMAGIQITELAHATLLNGSRNHGGRRAGLLSYGQIEDFSYDSSTKSGSLKVIQVYSRGLGRRNNSRQYALRFHVSVAADGFHVDTKDLSKNPANVFPNAALATGIVIDAQTASQFNYKLYARGTKISVTRIDWDRDFDLATPAWKQVLPTADPLVPGNIRNDPVWAQIMLPDADACIDMMFAGPPPSSLPNGARPPFYCLGRCANPPIINTW